MKRPMYYVLVDKKPRPVKDVMQWSRFYSDFEKNRRIARETIGGVDVSTVFLGIDHGIFSEKPVLFETMVFGGAHDEYCERCSTWDEAVEMHKRAVEMVRASFG